MLDSNIQTAELIDRELLESVQSLYDDDGSGNMFNELITLYLNDAAMRLAQIKRAAQESNVAGVLHAAHTLKGSSANVGAAAVASICAEVEGHARIGSIEIAASILPELEREFERTRIVFEDEVLQGARLSAHASL